MALYYLVTVQAQNYKKAHKAAMKLMPDRRLDYPFKFKVVEEPVIILILENPAKVFDMEMENVKVSYQPLVAYEDWANIIEGHWKSSPRHPSTIGHNTIYWVNLDYTGMTVNEFQDCWKNEAEAMFTARSEEQLYFDAFKVSMERRIHLFLGNDAIAIEKTVNMGDRVPFEMKILRRLVDEDEENA